MRPAPALFLSGIFLLSLLASCKKENHGSASPPPPRPTAPNVYVLGTEGNVALYWKNGVPTKLDSQAVLAVGFNSSSLAVSNGHVYISGARPNYNGSIVAGIPVYWLNGVATTLPDSSGNASGNAIFVAGTDVYEAGSTLYPDTSHVPYSTPTADYPRDGQRATIWKNGMPVSLPGYGVVGLVDSAKYAVRSYEDYVNSIYVSGTDVYVSGGSFWQPAHAGYWKNGVRVDLTGSLSYTASNGSSGFPNTTSLFVAGSDVYVTGYEATSLTAPVAIYWKNGASHFLSTDSINGSQATSVFVSGGDVYIAGWQNINGYSRATVWKNGIATTLTSGSTSSSANAVRVSGSDVYVAGSQWVAPGHYVAVYWKNGIPVTLTDGSTNAIAFSIQIE